MILEEKACIEKVNEWIAKTKREAYKNHINPQSSDTIENPEELIAYKMNLENLEDKLSKAIQKEDMEALSALHWPDDLKECIKEMTIRGEILDLLNQAFTISHFNKSQEHTAELINEAELRNETPL
jgi:hypothetical protein